MKRAKSFLRIIIPLGLAALPGADAAAGGTTVMNDVTIIPDAANPSQTIATGAAGVARFNPPIGNMTKEIGCTVTTFAATPGTPPGSSVSCVATRGLQQLSCFSDDPGVVATALNVSTDSTITFEAVPAAPNDPPNSCLWLQVANDSKFRPKSP